MQGRGIGTDIAIVSCMVFLAQVKLLHCCIALAFLKKEMIHIPVHPLPVYGLHRGQGRLHCRCGNIFWHKQGRYHHNLYKCHPVNLGIDEPTFIRVLPLIVSCRYPLYPLCPGCHGLYPLLLRSGFGKLCHLHGAVVDRSFHDNWQRPIWVKKNTKVKQKHIIEW